jgi:endonuclease V-like protein UPF0215 family
MIRSEDGIQTTIGRRGSQMMSFTMVRAVLTHWVVHTSPLDFVPEDARHALYQTVMSASVTIAGFTLTSVSVLINLLRTPVAAIDTLLRPADKR